MNPIRKAVIGGALVAATVTGGAIGGALVNGAAVAQTDPATTTTVPDSSVDPPAGRPADPSRGGHVGADGAREELLTGDTAEKVKAAALAAVPGGTVERVENDAEGSPYEAHMTTADGARVTVKVDAEFNVTGTEEGHGAKGPR